MVQPKFFSPEDADMIVDTATGATLETNQLQIIEVIARSSTRLYANPEAYKDPQKKAAIDHLVLILKSVLAARERVMIELNAPKEALSKLIERLPAMRQPTISTLYGDEGFAVKAAVPKQGLPDLIGDLRELGGTDIVISLLLSQIVSLNKDR